jgi:two-component system, chemotaxis family, chemotaxis protein CheY
MNRIASELPTAIIVDDSPVSRVLIRSIVTNAGIKVVGEGATGEDALTLWERHRPALAIFDLALPRIDGIHAATSILSHYPNGLIFACSAFATLDRVRACQRAGIAHFFVKPIDPGRFAAVAREMLGIGRRTQPGSERSPERRKKAA